MSDEPKRRSWQRGWACLQSPIAARIITGLQVCFVLAAIVELCFGGPGIFVRSGLLGLFSLTIGMLKKPKDERSDAA